MIEDFYSRLNGAIEEATSEYVKKPFYPKCWWSADLSASMERRRHIKFRKKKVTSKFFKLEESKSSTSAVGGTA